MSFEAMTWAAKQKTGDPASKLVLMLLGNYAGADGSCWPSQETLAGKSECSERSIRSHLAKLEDLGFVRREERRRKDGSKTTDLIILCMDAPDDILELGNEPSPPAKSAGGSTGKIRQGHRQDTTGSPAKSAATYKDEPVIEPIIEPSRAASPDDDVEFDFEDMRTAFTPHDPQDNLHSASKVFADLSREDRALAVKAAPEFCRKAKASGQRIPYLISYLRNRKFEPAPGPGVPVECEFVTPGTDRWREVAAIKSDSLMRAQLTFIQGRGEVYVYYPKRTA